MLVNLRDICAIAEQNAIDDGNHAKVLAEARRRKDSFWTRTPDLKTVVGLLTQATEEAWDATRLDTLWPGDSNRPANAADQHKALFPSVRRKIELIAKSILEEMNEPQPENEKKPEEPPLRMLFIPANSSATAVYQVLSDNGGEGLMFETEGDTLANTFGSDYGNYSDGFRKAFHHETISYVRRKDREYVNLKHPKLSTLLTGTPRQILNLITDAENGLFSRFAFYYLNTRLIWNNVFDNSTDGTLDEYFQKMGAEYQDLYNILKSADHDLKFRFTIEQEEDFNATFDALQDEYVAECGEEFVASVRRLGVIMFRIAMCISVLRLTEDGSFEDDITCLDIDYQTAKTIALTLIQHNAKVFSTLPSTPQPVMAKGGQRGRLKQVFLERLPAEFDRKTYAQLAEEVGLNAKSIDRTIRKWCEEGILENVAHGRYKKC